MLNAGERRGIIDGETYKRKKTDVTIIFISKFDLFKEKRTVYHVKRCLEETGTFVDNGFHEIYVNTKVNDGSDIAELMSFFKDSTGYHSRFPRLSDRARLFKTTEEGIMYMSSVVEDYISKIKEEVKRQARQEGLQEGRREGMQEGRREGRRESCCESVRRLIENRVAHNEQEACRMLSVDYDEFLKWESEQQD